MAETLTYIVPGMTCDHCRRAVSDEVGSVVGVATVEVDLAAKHVVVTGDRLDDQALRAAIAEAGYEVS